MKIFFIVILIVVGLVLIFVIHPLQNKKKKIIKNLKTTTVAKLIQKFEQMTILDRGDTYYELVELVGHIRNQNLVETPFSKQFVAYAQATANVLAQKVETIKDNRGFDQNKITNIERTIYNKSFGDKLFFSDDSTSDYVVIEASAGCQMDIMHLPEKEISKEEFDSLNLGIASPYDNSEIIGYKVKENILPNDSLVYVVGEARKSGGIIHICLSRNLKSPFVVSTNRKELFLETEKKESYLFLIIGIISIVLSIILLF